MHQHRRARGDRQATARSRPEPTRGQVVPFMAGCVVVVALVGLGVAHVAVEATQRARAQNAADAAALAAALRLDPADARRVAGQVAAHNGATVTEVQRFGATTVVRVTIAGHRAVAAARPVTASSAVAP